MDRREMLTGTVVGLGAVAFSPLLRSAPAVEIGEPEAVPGWFFSLAHVQAAYDECRTGKHAWTPTLLVVSPPIFRELDQTCHDAGIDHDPNRHPSLTVWDAGWIHKVHNDRTNRGALMFVWVQHGDEGRVALEVRVFPAFGNPRDDLVMLTTHQAPWDGIFYAHMVEASR